MNWRLSPGIHRRLDRIEEMLGQLGAKMAVDYTNLNTSLSDLKAEVGDIGTRMDKLFADLQAAIAGGDQAQIDAATAAVQEQVTALKAIGDRDTPQQQPAA